MQEDLPHQGSIYIGVNDGNDLRHTGPGLWTLRWQGRSGNRFVQITGYGASFMEREAIVLQNRNTAKRMQFAIAVRRLIIEGIDSRHSIATPFSDRSC